MNKKTYILLVATIFLLMACKKGLKRDELFAAQGCMAGGFGAAALVYIKKIGDKDAKDKAVIAGMLGCMAGAVVGHKVGRKTQDYADAQSAADQEIAQNEKSTQSLNKYNTKLASNISDYEQQIETIRNSALSETDKKKNLVKTKEIVAKQKDKAAKSLESVEKEVATAESIYAEYSNNSNRETDNQWQEKVAALQQERSILANHVQTLNALDASI